MRIKKGKKSKQSNDVNWWTPDDLFDYLTKTYHFRPNFDIAATKANSFFKNYYDKKTNALIQKKWKFPRKKEKVRGWLNPPNDEIGPFLLKAYEQFKKFGIRTMMIVPSNVESTKAWWIAVEDPIDRGEKIFFKAIKRRPKFKLRGRNYKHSSINSYKVVIFGRKKR